MCIIRTYILSISIIITYSFRVPRAIAISTADLSTIRMSNVFSVLRLHFTCLCIFLRRRCPRRFGSARFVSFIFSYWTRRRKTTGEKKTHSNSVRLAMESSVIVAARICVFVMEKPAPSSPDDECPQSESLSVDLFAHSTHINCSQMAFVLLSNFFSCFFFVCFFFWLASALPRH